MIYRALLVFTFGLLIDAVYVFWVVAVEKNRIHLAGLCTVCIATSSSLGFLDIVDNHWLLVPYLFGIYLGTILGVWLKRRFADAPAVDQGP